MVLLGFFFGFFYGTPRLSEIKFLYLQSTVKPPVPVAYRIPKKARPQ